MPLIFLPCCVRSALPRLAGLLALAALVPACALDGLFLTEMTREGTRPAPDPAPQHIKGDVLDGAFAQITLLGGDGVELQGPKTAADGQGRFSLELPGSLGLRGALLQARQGRKQRWVVVPELPAQPSVLAPERTFALPQLSPGALQADVTTTTMALLVQAKLKLSGKSLTSAVPSLLTDGLITLHQRLAQGDDKLVPVALMVTRILAAADGKVGAEADLPFDPVGSPSFLRLGFLQAQAVDYTGDGQADGSTAAFDAALTAAATTVELPQGCFAPDEIVVVLQTRLQEGAKDANCEPINPYLWADKKVDSRVFVTGGVHKDTPVCTAPGQPHCLQPQQVDELNAALGGWVPNQVAMYDDGTHGDAKAGDGLWTLALKMPWWDPKAAPGGVGVRIAYKFTFGSPKQIWTGSEEFPGNQRLLELVDVNQDGVIVRFDYFADQTSNKDKASQLQPDKGGCGENKWLQVTAEGCASDTREKPTDLDGDCVVDGWPPAGPVAPLTVACP